MGELTTTPAVESDEHPAVVAYRLGEVEKAVNAVSAKLDLISQNYPNTQTIQLILQPIKDDVHQLKEDKKENTKLKAQLILALGIAIFSPVISGVIVLLFNA